MTSQISKQIFVKMHTSHVYNRSTVELPVSKTRIKHIVTIILTSRVCFINAIVRCSFELKPCRLSGVFSRCDLTTSCQISKSFVMMWCSGYSIRKCLVPRTERVLLYFNLSQIANTPRWWKSSVSRIGRIQNGAWEKWYQKFWSDKIIKLKHLSSFPEVFFSRDYVTTNILNVKCLTKKIFIRNS